MPDRPRWSRFSTSSRSETSELVKQKVSRRKGRIRIGRLQQALSGDGAEGTRPDRAAELFSPGFLEWTTTIDREVDFGINDRQLWFSGDLWERLRGAETRPANAGELLQTAFTAEMDEDGSTPIPADHGTPALSSFPG